MLVVSFQTVISYPDEHGVTALSLDNSRERFVTLCAEIFSRLF